MALIEIERLCKTYPGSATPAVDDLTLHVEAGEFITLLGPSGSGKTSTLLLLAGFEQPSAGHSRLDGRPIETLPPHQRGMGVVFQSYSLFPHMTVAQNVAFPLQVRKWPAATIAKAVSSWPNQVSSCCTSSTPPCSAWHVSTHGGLFGQGLLELGPVLGAVFDHTGPA